jgi:hypothetical protein
MILCSMSDLAKIEKKTVSIRDSKFSRAKKIGAAGI